MRSLGIPGYPHESFRPCAVLDRPLDRLTVLHEDVSYRSVFVEPVLDILLHPYENTAVGFHLNGIMCVLLLAGAGADTAELVRMARSLRPEANTEAWNTAERLASALVAADSWN